MKKLAILLSALFTTMVAHAEIDLSQDPYYQIKEVRVEVIEDNEEAIFEDVSNVGTYVEQKSVQQSIGEVIKTGDEIIAFGKRVYAIIEAGRPVVSSSYAPISVLPFDKKTNTYTSAMNLSYWKGPRSKKYRVSYENGFGMNVVDFTYNINMSYGGSNNGKGLYLTNVQIVPQNISVAWGYTFDAKMILTGITNKGSQDSPIASATLNLSYTVSTVIKEDRNNYTYEVVGNGQINEI